MCKISLLDSNKTQEKSIAFLPKMLFLDYIGCGAAFPNYTTGN
jgi:hypothetical protein